VVGPADPKRFAVSWSDCFHLVDLVADVVLTIGELLVVGQQELLTFLPHHINLILLEVILFKEVR